MQEEADRQFRQPLPHQSRHQHEVLVLYPEQVVRSQDLQHCLGVPSQIILSALVSAPARLPGLTGVRLS